MKVIVKGENIKGGSVEAPSSKSYTHRAIAISSLSEEESKIKNPLVSRDTLSTIRGVRALGADVEKTPSMVRIRGFGNKPETPMDVIDLRNSGTSLRFIIGISSLLENGSAVLTGDKSLRQRPNQPLLDAINAIGANSFSTNRDGTPPIVVEGKLRGGEVKIRGDVSSQFISSLLIATPSCEEDTHIKPIPPVKSKPYIDMTIDVLEEADVSIRDRYFVEGKQEFSSISYEVPGDYSSSSNILVMGALFGDIEVTGLKRESLQADYRILELLENAGAKIVHGENYVGVEQANLVPFRADLSKSPDLFPILAVLGSFIEGDVVLENVSHIRYKETDRIEVMKKELTKMGVETRITEDDFIVVGNDPKGASVSGHGDHRIVMALTVAALGTDEVSEISGVESVEVSYPNFFTHLKKLGAKIEFKGS